MYFNKLWPVMITKNTKVIIMGVLPLARHVKFPCRNVQISARKERDSKKKEGKKTKYFLQTFQMTFNKTTVLMRIHAFRGGFPYSSEYFLVLLKPISNSIYKKKGKHNHILLLNSKLTNFRDRS